VVGSLVHIRGSIMGRKAENVTLCMGHNTPMLQCIGLKKDSEFFSSWSPFHSNGKVPYCKECCGKMFQYYLDETKSAKTALYYTLMRIDIPFIKSIYEIVNERSLSGDKNGKRTPINIGTYVNELRRYSKNKEIWSDFSATDVDITEVDAKIQTAEIKQKEMKQWEIDWGIQDEVCDYEFLNDTFNRYTKGVEFVNPQQEDLYRDLCRDRLLLRKINDNRYNGDETIDKVQNRISKTMATFKVDQFESNKPKTASEQSFFAKIAQIEQTKPADLYKEPKKYKDFNKLRQYEEDMVLRPLLNTLCGHRDFDINIEDAERYNLDDD
jgi:hypothetical protein